MRGSEVGQGQNWKRTNTYVTSLNWVLKISRSMTVMGDSAGGTCDSCGTDGVTSSVEVRLNTSVEWE